MLNKTTAQLATTIKTDKTSIDEFLNEKYEEMDTEDSIPDEKNEPIILDDVDDIIGVRNNNEIEVSKQELKKEEDDEAKNANEKRLLDYLINMYDGRTIESIDYEIRVLTLYRRFVKSGGLKRKDKIGVLFEKPTKNRLRCDDIYDMNIDPLESEDYQEKFETTKPQEQLEKKRPKVILDKPIGFILKDIVEEIVESMGFEISVKKTLNYFSIKMANKIICACKFTSKSITFEGRSDAFSEVMDFQHTGKQTYDAKIRIKEFNENTRDDIKNLLEASKECLLRKHSYNA